MRLLILARHAKSSWENPELEDFERPLNSRGHRDAPEMANRLKRLDVKPDIILSSPAIRAVMTARIYAVTLHFPLNKINYSESVYSDGYTELFKSIRDFPDTFSQIMMVGHNPVMTDLANHLMNEEIDNMPTAGVVGIWFNDKSWSDIRSRSGKIKFFEFPKKKSK
jgi:phosphohistidine phosphatase